jgi:hypothetical protein
MFAQLSTLIPGFDLTPETIPSSISHTISDSHIDLKLLIEDSNACTGEFVIYSVLELFLRRQTSPANVIFVGAMQSFSHYSAVLKKLVGIRMF